MIAMRNATAVMKAAARYPVPIFLLIPERISKTTGDVSLAGNAPVMSDYENPLIN